MFLYQPMNKTFWETLLTTMSESFSHQKILCSPSGEPMDYEILHVNKAYEILMGKSSEEIIGRTIRELKPMVDQEWIQFCGGVALSGIPQVSERYIPYLNKYLKINVFSHHPGEFSILFTDITDSRHSLEVAQRYRNLLETSPDIVLFINRNGTIMDVNNAAVSTYGYSREELIGFPISQLRTHASLSLFTEQFDKAVSCGLRFETEHKRKDGTSFPVEVSSKSTYEQGEILLMSIIRDISLQKQHESDIRRMATCDILTGCLNRMGFYEEVEKITAQVAQHRQKMALLYFDLDHFKAINDHYGHGAGDYILKTFVGRIQQVMTTDDCLGRMGGDEFVLALAQVSSEDMIIHHLNRIIQMLNEPIPFQDIQIHMSASIGVSIYPTHGDHYHQLLQYADQSMYESKKTPGTHYTFYKKL